MESFHSILKREWLNRFKIRDYKQAYRLIFEYLEAFYNTKRSHSHCDFMSPDEFERVYKRAHIKAELLAGWIWEKFLILTCTKSWHRTGPRPARRYQPPGTPSCRDCRLCWYSGSHTAYPRGKYRRTGATARCGRLWSPASPLTWMGVSGPICTRSSLSILCQPGTKSGASLLSQCFR